MADVIVAEGSTLNWTTIKSGSAPAAGDNVIFPKGGRYNFTNGPAASVNLASIQIQPGAVVILPDTFTMEVNNSGKGLVIDRARAVRMILSGNTNKVSVAGLGGSGSDDAGVQLAGGAHAAIHADDGGRVSVGTGATLTDLVASNGGMIDVQSHASDTIATIRLSGGGRIWTYRTALAATIGRGDVKLRGGATIANAGSGYVDLIDDLAKLVFENTSALTLDLVRAWAGLVHTANAQAGITFTNTVRTRRSTIQEDFMYGSIVYTNAPTDYGTPGGAHMGVDGSV